MIGRTVLIRYDRTRDRQYVAEARVRRALGDSRVGLVVAHSDSHGLCYKVAISEIGEVAWYDPEELEDVHP